MSCLPSPACEGRVGLAPLYLHCCPGCIISTLFPEPSAPHKPVLYLICKADEEKATRPLIVLFVLVQQQAGAPARPSGVRPTST